jgi:hypothetical protein
MVPHFLASVEVPGLQLADVVGTGRDIERRYRTDIALPRCVRVLRHQWQRQTGLTSPTSGSSCIAISRPTRPKFTSRKVRDNWVGQPGKVTLDYDEATGRYSEPVQRPVVAAWGYRDE